MLFRSKGERLAAVRILNGPMAKKVLELRKPFNTLGFNGHKLAMISRNIDGYSISTIKTAHTKKPDECPLLNQHPINHDSTTLNDRDILELAGTQMEFFYLY